MKVNIMYDEIPVYHNYHGFVKITPLEKEVINSVYLQSLKVVKQLSFAYYVLTGDEHMRFSQSIAVLAVVEKILNRFLEIQDEQSYLIITEDDVKILRMAALLHDIGHYPFSAHAVTRILRENGFTLNEINDISIIIPKALPTN